MHMYFDIMYQWLPNTDIISLVRYGFLIVVCYIFQWPTPTWFTRVKNETTSICIHAWLHIVP